MTAIFEGQPPKQCLNSNQNKGHLGSRYIVTNFHGQPEKKKTNPPAFDRNVLDPPRAFSPEIFLFL